MHHKLYSRVLVKIPGHSLGNGGSFDAKKMLHVVRELDEIGPATELLVVPGGNNMVSGAILASELHIAERVAHNVGMLATISNALLLKAIWNTIRPEREVVVMSAVEIPKLVEPFLPEIIPTHLSHGRVVILAGGIGQAGVTTDFCAVLNAHNFSAQILIRATDVDGVYDRDPKNTLADPATLLEHITYSDFLARKLQFLDADTLVFAQTRSVPIRVCNITKHGFLRRAVMGENVGTLISK